jgi:hypothetical protein
MATAFKKMLAKKQEKSESSSSKDNEDQASVSSSDQEVEIDPVSFDYDLSFIGAVAQCVQGCGAAHQRVEESTKNACRVFTWNCWQNAPSCP